MDTPEHEHKTSPNWGLRRIGSRDNLTAEYEYANNGYGASVFVVDTGERLGCRGGSEEQVAGNRSTVRKPGQGMTVVRRRGDRTERL
jgi:hypothetical protein